MIRERSLFLLVSLVGYEKALNHVGCPLDENDINISFADLQARLEQKMHRTNSQMSNYADMMPKGIKKPAPIMNIMQLINIIGSIRCNLDQKVHDQGHLSFLTVSQQHQGKGIGKAMLNLCQSSLIQCNCNQIDLEVVHMNMGGLREAALFNSYAKLGYFNIGQISAQQYNS